MPETTTQPPQRLASYVRFHLPDIIGCMRKLGVLLIQKTYFVDQMENYQLKTISKKNGQLEAFALWTARTSSQRGPAR
jgi:hypothetical protein